jgi:uncharacterized membrane protein YbhN (UPF0104 family)
VKRQGRGTRCAARIAQIVIAVGALVFAFRALRNFWSDSSGRLGQIHPEWGWIATSGVVFLATYAVLVETWREMLRSWGSDLSFRKAARIWTVSNLGRYVPGKLWQIGAMGMMAQRARVSAIAATGSAILNVVVNLVAGFAVVALFGWPLLNLPALGGIRTGVLFIVACVTGLTLLPVALPPFLRWLTRLTGRDLAVGPLPPIAIFLSLIGNLVAWLLYGVAFALFARGVLGSSQGPLTAYVAVYALSYLVGYLVLFAPAGVGFREAAMIALLPAAHLADPSQATILAVTSRLWLTALEIAPGALFLGLDGLRRRPRAQ